MVIDLGTGDGRAVLRRALREPASLVIGIDPVAAALREASRRAAGPVTRGGMPNALLLGGSAEELPWLLAGRADELTVALPWGSLLRGVAGDGTPLASRLARTLRPGGRLELLLSVAPTDVATGVPALTPARLVELAVSYADNGFSRARSRPATADDVARLSGSWGRRLGIPARRPAYVLELTAGPAKQAAGPSSAEPAAAGQR